MLKSILKIVEAQLKEYLQKDFPDQEGIIKVCSIGKDIKSGTNKLVISMFGIERETAGGIASVRNNCLTNTVYDNPPLLMNFNLIFAAIFEESKYDESLSVLSKTVLFIQSHPSFKDGDATYTLELVSPNLQELNNIWSIMGGQYYPSLLCKIRRVTFDSGEFRCATRNIESVEINLKS